MKKLLFVIFLVSLLLFTSCSTSNTNTETSDSTKNDISENKRTVNLDSEDPFPGYTRELFGKPEPVERVNSIVEKRWYLKIDDCLTNDFYSLFITTQESGKEYNVRHSGPYLTDENIKLMRQSLPIINENINAFDEQTKEEYLKANSNLEAVNFNKTKFLLYYDGEVLPIIKLAPIVENDGHRNYREFSYNAKTKELIDETKLPKPNVETIEIGE